MYLFFETETSGLPRNWSAPASEVGNWPRLTQAREQAFYADATAQLARARQAQVAARERLTRLMGLWGEQTAFALPERLPEPPATVKESIELEAQALRQRLDVQAARRDAASLAASLELRKVTRYVDLIEIGALRNTETGQEDHRGWELELRIPIFDFGGARVARADKRSPRGVQEPDKPGSNPGTAAGRG